MKDELPAVCIRKKVLAKKRNEGKAAKANDEEGRNKTPPDRNDPSQQRRVDGTDFFEASLKCTLEARKRATGFPAVVAVHLQQVLGQRGYQRTRQNVRGDHGEDDRLSERDKEELSYAVQKEHRKKDDTDAQS